jgi:hypothetical protein
MFETYMVHKYVKGMLIGKTYYQGTTMKTLTYYMAKAYRDGEVRFGKTVFLMRQECINMLMEKKSFYRLLLSSKAFQWRNMITLKKTYDRFIRLFYCN